MPRPSELVTGNRLSRFWSWPMLTVLVTMAFVLWTLGYVPEP